MQITIGGLAVSATSLSAPVSGVTVTGEGSKRTLEGDHAALKAQADAMIALSTQGDEPSRRAIKAIYRELGLPAPWAVVLSEQ